MLHPIDGFALPVDRVALLNDCLFAPPLTDRATVDRVYYRTVRVSRSVGLGLPHSVMSRAKQHIFTEHFQVVKLNWTVCTDIES